LGTRKGALARKKNVSQEKHQTKQRGGNPAEKDAPNVSASRTEDQKKAVYSIWEKRKKPKAKLPFGGSVRENPAWGPNKKLDLRLTNAGSTKRVGAESVE